MQRKESIDELVLRQELSMQKQLSNKVEYPLELIELEDNDETNLIKPDEEI